MRPAKRLLLLLAPLLFTGCIYRRTIEPLDVRFAATPVYRQTDQGGIKHFKYFLINFQWDSNAIGRIAREHGLSEVYYADLETLSILRVWNRYTVHVYGRKSEGGTSEAGEFCR